MVNVHVYEIRRDRMLAAVEKRINRRLAVEGVKGASVRLFRTQDGEVGYSAQVSHLLPSAEGRRALDAIHRAVCEATGYKRGRPTAGRTHQVKCRLGDTVYQKVVREAKKRSLTPAGFVASVVTEKMTS